MKSIITKLRTLALSTALFLTAFPSIAFADDRFDLNKTIKDIGKETNIDEASKTAGNSFVTGVKRGLIVFAIFCAVMAVINFWKKGFKDKTGWTFVVLVILSLVISFWTLSGVTID